MKRLLSMILIILMICMAFSACRTTANEEPETASEALEELFTTIDLMDATISDLQEEMEAGHITSEKLTQMYIDRINTYDAKLKLNSVIDINPDALRDAKALDQEREEGNTRGPLHGIPIVVKANCDIAGMATSAGANALADMIATEDCFVVKQLRDAGAVILAQTNLSEFAYSSITSRSTLGGYVHNAYDTTKTPGGSSGGTAVAVTCSFAAAGVGTDTGGSIRNPSSLSNLYGVRPSKGLTSTGGVFPLAAYRDTTGPIARTAEDMALMLEIMAGTDQADDYTVEADADAMLSDGCTVSLSADALKGMRIGFLESSFRFSGEVHGESVNEVADDKVSEMVSKAVGNLKKAGAVTVDLSPYLNNAEIKKLSKGIRIETFEYDVNQFLRKKGYAAPYKTVKELQASGNDGVMHVNLDRILADDGELADSLETTKNPYTKTFGSYQRIPNYQKVLDARKKIAAIMKEHDIDAIMYLNNFDVAGDEDDPKNNNHYNDAGYDIIFSALFGLPEISLPMGFSYTDSTHRRELPLGLSIFAAYGDDETLMQIAYSYEQQVKEIIRRSPDMTPALKDEALNDFLEDLIEKACSVDHAKYEKASEGKIQRMQSACEKAKTVDTDNPYAVYDAAKKLAEAYDKVIEEIGNKR